MADNKQQAKKLGLALPPDPFGASPEEVENSLPIPRKTVEIDSDRWDKTYPYTFSIVKADHDGLTTTNVSPDFSMRVELMIPPSGISIGVVFANSVSATNRGVIEENNGVVFRNISISGTTGILPEREVADNSPLSGAFGLKQANAIFPAATGALSSLVAKIKSFSAPTATQATGIGAMSGYYNFWELHNLFVRYAEYKKKGQSDLRLVFDCPKDNVAYVVTPVAFDLRKDSSSPFLYRYSIQLKAWDMTTSKTDTKTFKDEVTPDNLLSVGKTLDTIRKCRQVILASSNVLRGVQSDVAEIFNGVNQVSLALKDVAGVANQIIDFLPTIKANLNTLILSNRAQWAQVLSDRKEIIARINAQDGRSIGEMFDNNMAQGLGLSKASSVNKVGSQAGAAAAGKSDAGDLAASLDPKVTKLASKALDNPEVADDISMSEIQPLPQSVARQVGEQVELAKSTTANQVRDLANQLKKLNENLANASGMMDASYAEAFGVAVAPSSGRAPTEDDILLSAAIEEQRAALISTLSSGAMYKEMPENLFNAANEVVDSTERMDAPLSAYAIIVDQGMTLEKIALKYLGDIRRARDIAILNNLRAPYIDEDGFVLLVRGVSKRSFVVSDRSNLSLHQAIVLMGDGVASSKRRIIRIQDISSGSYEVTVDGTQSLDQFASAPNARIRARRPGTVGSGDILLIPSSQQADDPTQSRSTPLSSRLQFAEKLFKVDLSLTKEGDLALGPDGDIQRSYGYANAIQALRLLVETEQGELELHPEYGINARVGDRIDSDLKSEIASRIKQSVSQDSRFLNAAVEVTTIDTGLNIRLEARGKDNSGLIPVEFKITL